MEPCLKVVLGNNVHVLVHEHSKEGSFVNIRVHRSIMRIFCEHGFTLSVEEEDLPYFPRSIATQGRQCAPYIHRYLVCGTIPSRHFVAR